MPTSTLTIDLVGGPPGEYAMRTDDGALAREGLRQWHWQAPAAPGVSTLHVDGPSDRNAMTLRALVMVPATRMKDGYLNGYRMGAYPDKPLNDNPIYRAPRGFVEVTRKNETRSCRRTSG